MAVIRSSIFLSFASLNPIPFALKTFHPHPWGGGVKGGWREERVGRGKGWEVEGLEDGGRRRESGREEGRVEEKKGGWRVRGRVGEGEV